MENFRGVLRAVLLLAFSNIVQAETFLEVALKAHNEYRAKHKAQPLTLDEDATQYAENYAQFLADSNRDTLEHSKGNPYGENLYISRGTLPDDETLAKSAVDAWYAEKKDYDFEKPGFRMNTGHFTQVVWKDSNLLGMAIQRNAAGNKAYVVAEYSPRGNTLEEFPENVKSSAAESKYLVHWTTKTMSLPKIVPHYFRMQIIHQPQ